MRNAFPREFYIPTGARKVASKTSSAVAYVYERDGRPYAVAFAGRADKPLWRYRFRTTLERERTIAQLFASAQAREAEREARRAERLARGRGLEVGDVLRTCWGYEQTNIEWFQVTALIGEKSVEVRQIAGCAQETMWLQGKTVPLVDQFIGKPLRRRAAAGAVKIDKVRTGWKVEPIAMVGSRPVFEAAHYTAYA